MEEALRAPFAMGPEGGQRGRPSAFVWLLRALRAPSMQQRVTCNLPVPLTTQVGGQQRAGWNPTLLPSQDSTSTAQ